MPPSDIEGYNLKIKILYNCIKYILKETHFEKLMNFLNHLYIEVLIGRISIRFFPRETQFNAVTKSGNGRWLGLFPAEL